MNLKKDQRNNGKDPERSRRATLKKSINIINACLICVMIMYMIDVTYARWIYLRWIIPAIVILIPIKIYVFSGLCGMLVELTSREELFLQKSRFIKNANQYWKITLVLMTIPLFSHMSYTFLGLNRYNVPSDSFYVLFYPVIAFALAMFIIKKKYLVPLNVPKRKSKTSPNLLLTIGIFCLIQLSIFYLPYFWETGEFDLTRITFLLANYLNLFLFVYFVSGMMNQYPEITKKFSFNDEIYLINPLGGGLAFHLGSIFMGNYPPFFVVLKALTPKKYHFREINRRIWNQRYFASNKLVAITCFTSNCDDAYKIADGYRKAGSKVVMGGPHVSYLPDEALGHCDAVVMGEAESVWEEVIQDFESNSLKKKYFGVALEECHELVYEELLHSPPKVIKDFLETSRGCKFKCHFCTIPSLSSGKVRTQPVFKVVELIKKINPKLGSVFFIDNNIYSDPAYARELFKALKPLKIKWHTQCTIDIAKNEETLKLAKESGCSGLLIGFEITEGSFEKQQGGKFAMADKYREYANKIRNMGISIKAHYIFGFESDCFQNLIRAWKFCFSIQPFITVFSILTPLPGAALFDDMIKRDCITNYNWQRYGCQTMVFDHSKVNSFILGKSWPLIQVFFLLTTSKLGYSMLAVLLIIIVVSFGGFPFNLIVDKLVRS